MKLEEYVFKAVENNNLDNLKYLYWKNPNIVNIEDDMKRIPLHLAYKLQHNVMINFLCERSDQNIKISLFFTYKFFKKYKCFLLF